MTSRHIVRLSALTGVFLLTTILAFAGEKRHITLAEAVRLALAQNRSLKIARLKVTENEYKKAAAKTDYFPTIINQSNALHITELQGVTVPAGAFGTVSGISIPAVNTNVLQGKETLYTSGTMITQPLTQLLRIRQENRIASSEIATSRDDLKNSENEIALQVHSLYYGILVAQLQKKAAEQDASFASTALSENLNHVRGGSALEVAEIQSKAELLQAEQTTLTADLQIQDYTTELNDLLGLPLDTQLELEPEEVKFLATLSKAEYIKTAWDENPQVHAAQDAIEKARAAVNAAKTYYIPDVTAFARYSYQDGVPFFVRNFGTFGINLNYTVWDFNKRHDTVKERQTQLAEAEQNLEHLKEEVAVAIEHCYNKLERTRNMVGVAIQVARLREESERLANDQQTQGVVLISDVRHATAASYKAKADLLQANLAYQLAWAELERTIGHTPRDGTP